MSRKDKQGATEENRERERETSQAQTTLGVFHRDHPEFAVEHA